MLPFVYLLVLNTVDAKTVLKGIEKVYSQGANKFKILKLVVCMVIYHLHFIR